MLTARPITFVNGVVFGSDGRRFESIRVRRGVVDRLGGPPDRRDTVFDLDGSAVFPGLINAHDHLELNSFGRLKWRARYDNVRDWIADFQPRFARDPALAAARPDTLADRLWVGGLKNLLAGVTTVCHHNPLHRVLRGRFPVRVVSRFGMSHSLGIDGETSVARAFRTTPSCWPWIIHAAEGLDEQARAEIDQLGKLGCLAANTVLVHGVALGPEGASRVLMQGASLIWCPSSNEFLFGETADVRRFNEAGRLALGSDSRLSGRRDLLDELGTAHATGQLDARSLVCAVTAGGAASLRLGDAGRLDVGAPADLIVLRLDHRDPRDALVAAKRIDIRLTMRGGEPLVAEPSLEGVFAAARVPFRLARVDEAPRLLARWIARRVARLALPEPGLELAS
ncbi:MAG: amidohydrolase family protein [Acidobacteriota bacterium]